MIGVHQLMRVALQRPHRSSDTVREATIDRARALLDSDDSADVVVRRLITEVESLREARRRDPEVRR